VAEVFEGTVDIQDDAGTNVVITLNGNTGAARLGGNGQTGDLIIRDAAGNARVRIEGATGEISVFGDAGTEVLRLTGSGDVRTGGNGVNGALTLQSTDGSDRIRLQGSNANAWLGGNGTDGDVALFAEGGDNATLGASTIHLAGAAGDIRAGGNGVNGALTLQDTQGSDRIRLQGSNANAWLGGNGADGDVALFAEGGDNATLRESTIHLGGAAGDIRAGGNGVNGALTLQDTQGSDRIRFQAGDGQVLLGGNGADGDLLLFAEDGNQVGPDEASIHLDGAVGNLRMGGQGQDGDVILREAGGDDRIRMDAGEGNLFLGGNGVDGDVLIFADSGDNVTFEEATIHLNGQDGDIILRNADCAEEFDLAAEEALPGTVVVIGGDGRLRASTTAYDRRVAGVISGAGACKPGIVLDRNPSASPRGPVALLGKVFCKVDASYGAIDVGDMLTTSPTAGHAMRAEDPARAFGAVIGKALDSHESGQGLVPVLVAMQ
jgi:hypothetical protein